MNFLLKQSVIDQHITSFSYDEIQHKLILTLDSNSNIKLVMLYVNNQGLSLAGTIPFLTAEIVLLPGMVVEVFCYDEDKSMLCSLDYQWS